MVSMKILTSISIWWELGRIENGYSYVYNDKYFLASFSSQAITSSNSKGEISKIVATKSANATSSNKPVQGQIKDSTISLNYTTASSSSSSNTAPLPSTAAPKQQAINPQAALNNKTLNGNSNPILDNFKETIECMTVEGKHLGYFNDLNELARQTGVRRSVIYMISMKKQRTSKGLSFRIVKPSAATTVTEVEKEGWYELIRQHLRDYEINPAHYVAINVRSRMPTSSANRLSLGSPKKKTRAVVNREAEEDSEELNSEEDDEDEFEFKDPRIGDIYQIEVPPFVPPTEAMKHLASTASNDCVNKLFPIVPGPEGIPQIAMETSAQYQQALQKLFYLYKLMHCIPGMILPIAAKANNQFVTFRHAVILHHRNEYTMSTMIRVACAEHASIDLFLDAMKASLTEYDLEGMFPWLVYDGKMVQEISLSHLVLCDEDIVMESLHRCQGKLEDTFLLLFEHVRMKYLQIWSEDEVKTYRKHLPSTKLEENDLARCYRKHIETKSTTRSWKEFVAFHHQYSLLHHPHQNKSIKKRQEALANVFRASSFIRNFVLAPDHQHDEILQWDQRVWAALGRSHFSSYASNVFVSSTSSSVPTTNSSSSSSDTIFLPSEVPLDSKDGISLPEVAKEEDKEDDEDVGVEDSGESEHSANFREPLKLKSKTKSISGAIDTTSSKPEASKSLITSDDIVGKVMLRLKRKIEDISSSPNQTITPSIMTSKSVDTTTTIANPTSIEQSKKLSAASSVQISPEKTSDLSLGASNNGGNNSKSTQPMKKNELPLVSKAIAASTTVSSKPIIESNNKTISTNSPFLAKKSLLLQSANFANVEYASPANTSGNRGGSSEGNVVESTKNPWPMSTNELETDEKLICQDRKFRNFMLYIHGQQSVTLLNTLCKEHKWTSALMSKLPVAFREEALKIAHGIDAHLVFKHSIVYFRPQYYPNNNSPSSYANLQANRHYFLTYDAVKNYLLHLFSLIPSLPNQKNSLMQVVKTSPAAVVPVAAITNTNTNTTAITTAPPAATTTPSPAEVIIGRYRMSQAIGSAIPADKFPLFVEACLQDGFEMVTSSIYPTNDWIANFKALKAMGWKHMPLATGEFFFKTSKIFQQVGNSKEAWKAQEGVNIFVGRQQVEEYLQVKWISQGLVYFTRNRKTGLISSSLHTQLGVDFVSVVDETVKPTTTSIASFPTSSSDNTKINLPMPLPLPIPIKISTTSSSSTTPIAPPVQSTLQSVEIATMSRNATHMFTIVDFLYQCQDLVVTKLHTKETESILDYNASVTTAILEYLKIIIQSCQTLSDHPQDLVKYFNLVAKLTFKNVMEYSMSQIAHVVQDESKHAVATIFLKKSNLIVPSQVLQSTKQALQSIFHEYGNVIRGLLQLEQRGTRLVVNIPKSTALQIFYRTEGQAVELEARSRELPRMRKHVFQVAKVFTEMFMDKVLSAHDSVLFAQCKEWSMRLSTLQDPTDINNFLLALEQRPVYMRNLDGLQSMMELVHALQETKARTSNLFDRFVSKQQYASAWLHRMKSSHFPSGAVDPLTTIDAAGSAEGLLQVKASFCEWIENGLEPKYWDPFDTDL